MAVGPHALTSLAMVKAALRLGVDAMHDTELERLIDVVTARFENFTRRRLKSRVYKPSGASTAEVNLKLNGDDRLDKRRFLFPEYPLTALTALTLKDADLGNATVVTVSDVIIDPDTGLATFNENTAHEWRKGQQNIEATFTAGLTPVPVDLDQLCVIQVTHDFLERDRGREGIASISVEGQSVSYVERGLVQKVFEGLQFYARGRGLAGA